MEDLPVEILWEIFAGVDCGTLYVHARLVCKQWKCIIDDMFSEGYTKEDFKRWTEQVHKKQKNENRVKMGYPVSKFRTYESGRIVFGKSVGTITLENRVLADKQYVPFQADLDIFINEKKNPDKYDYKNGVVLQHIPRFNPDLDYKRVWRWGNEPRMKIDIPIVDPNKKKRPSGYAVLDQIRTENKLNKKK